MVCNEADYITIATCGAAPAVGATGGMGAVAPTGGMSTWGQCQCQPKCGNGVKQPGEMCDGADVGGATCMSMGKGTGPVLCTSQCALSTAMCVMPSGPMGGNGG